MVELVIRYLTSRIVMPALKDPRILLCNFKVAIKSVTGGSLCFSRQRLKAPNYSRRVGVLSVDPFLGSKIAAIALAL